MLAYAAIAITAAAVTALAVPAVARLATAVGAIDRPADPRRVHREPVPTMGGLAIVVGILAALGVGWLLPAFEDVYRSTSEPVGILVGVLVIAAIGAVDDVRSLPPSIKLAGQILAALGPVLFGIQVVYVWVPGLDVVALSPDLGMVLTVLAIVAMINAVNLIDGLDGLAAGVVLIAAVAFFVFTIASGSRGLAESVPTAAPLVVAATAGVAAGFLLHNWHPATIFMGDTGSMTLGLLLASAGIAYVGRSTAPSNTDFVGTAPLLIPALVLAIPMLDSLWAIARRAYKRQPIAVADKGHLHHLLIAFGHSHRRAVLTLYYWSFVLAFGTVAPSFLPVDDVLLGLGVAVTAGLLITALGVRSGGRTADETPVEVGRGSRRRRSAG